MQHQTPVAVSKQINRAEGDLWYPHSTRQQMSPTKKKVIILRLLISWKSEPDVRRTYNHRSTKERELQLRGLWPTVKAKQKLQNYLENRQDEQGFFIALWITPRRGVSLHLRVLKGTKTDVRLQATVEPMQERIKRKGR